jgi:hypothetical protein
VSTLIDEHFQRSHFCSERNMMADVFRENFIVTGVAMKNRSPDASITWVYPRNSAAPQGKYTVVGR